MLIARKLGDRRQSLNEHSLAVSEETAQRCADIGLENLGRLAGLLHDIGKAPGAWQHYLEYGGKMIFHAPYGAEFIQRIFKEEKGICASLTIQMLCMAVRAHHGSLHDALSPAGEVSEPEPCPYTPREIAQAEAAFFAEVVSYMELKRLFKLAQAEVETLLRQGIRLAKETTDTPADNETQKNEAMFYMGLAQRFLYSALIDADRQNAADWENEETPKKEAVSDWKNMRLNLEKRLGEFDKRGINKLRADISDKCGKFDAQNGVYRLFVPTGGGKTLSSLRLALNVAEKYKKRRILYAEPYLSILEQAADDIRKAIGEDEEFRKSGKESAVLEFHSNLVFDDDSEDEERRHLKLIERLDCPIVLTSTVQLLNAIFSGKSSAARRMAALSNSVIIVDEVQSVPTNSTYLFDLAVNFLAYYCNCLVILCTATPPELAGLKYPVRFGSRKDVIGNVSELFEAFKRTDIITYPGRKFNIPELSEFVMERMDENDNCLVIMNTKAAAKRLYCLLQESACEDYHLYYLSTALCPAHRAEKLKEIKKRLGNQKVVVISTQLIEVGVDISFKCVVRSLAGLDSIIQAAGRCNRHGETERGKVYVVDCEDEHLKMLKDIECGRKVCSKIIAMMQNAELASPEIVSLYYRQYFKESEGSLAYEVEGKTAIDLLGLNSKAREEYKRECGKVYGSDLLAQAFKTVGRAYKPISDDTTGIVVPHGNSKELLEKLKTAEGKEKTRCYRSLQRFSVNVYENALRKLYGAGLAILDEKTGLWVLNDAYYTDVGGIEISAETSIDDYIL